MLLLKQKLVLNGPFLWYSLNDCKNKDDKAKTYYQTDLLYLPLPLFQPSAGGGDLGPHTTDTDSQH
jgi:hypothetical protein